MYYSQRYLSLLLINIIFYATFGQFSILIVPIIVLEIMFLSFHPGLIHYSLVDYNLTFLLPAILLIYGQTE